MDTLKRWPRRKQTLATQPVPIQAGSAALTGQAQPWQSEAWRLYKDEVGEYTAVTDWRADAMSRANLWVAKRPADPDADPEPADDEVLTHILEQLGSGGRTGYGDMLNRMSTHLDVTGETFLVGHDSEATGRRLWTVASRSQLTTYGGSAAVQVDNTGQPESDYLTITPERAVVQRIYSPDPEQPWLAFSPGRYAAKPMKILSALTDRVMANTHSRLMNNLVLISDDVVLPQMPDRTDLHSDPQMAGLIYAGMTAIQHPESPAAVMPILARASGELDGKIEKIELGTEYDERLPDLIDLFLRRLALMLNVPPEVLLGVTEANHWTAFMVSDDAVRVHLAPTVETICCALTTAFLRPSIAYLNQQQAAIGGRVAFDPNDYLVWYDTTRMTGRPDRSEDAMAVYDRGELSGEALIAATGFDPSDAPSAAEVRSRILTELAKGNIPLETASPYLRALGINLNTTGDASSAAPDEGASASTPSSYPAGV